MTFVHGKNTVVMLDSDSLSAYSNNTGLEVNADSHDTTTYGKEAHVFAGGLKGGTTTVSGIYDNTAMVGPAAVIKPLIGTVVELIFRPDGTGSGKAQTIVDVLVIKYTETAPVADMVTWAVDLQHSDAPSYTAQSA